MHDNGIALSERQGTRFQRTIFIKITYQNRQENKPITYADEMCIHSTHTTPYSSSDNYNKGICVPPAKDWWLTTVHTSHQAGFVLCASLIFKSNLTATEYYDKMKSKNYVRQLYLKSIPNLTLRSVIVLYHTSYNYLYGSPTQNSNLYKKSM